MEIHPPLATNQTNGDHGYGLALKLAREQLAGVQDIEQLCRRSGARLETTDTYKTIAFAYLNELYHIVFPEISISFAGNTGEVPLRDRILILHYLAIARGTPLTHQLINYKELPEGTVYFRTFHLRAIKPLVANFGSNPERLLEVSRKLGGVRAEQGDVSVTIPAFPCVPVTLVLWRGDDEFPPDGNILFDSTVPDYLSVEDINVLCEILAWKLVKMLRESGG